MKAMAPLLAALGLIAAGGCATTGDAGVRVAEYDIDYQKVYLVDEWAKRNNTTVVWINYPQRRVTSNQ